MLGQKCTTHCHAVSWHKVCMCCALPGCCSLCPLTPHTDVRQGTPVSECKQTHLAPAGTGCVQQLSQLPASPLAGRQLLPPTPLETVQSCAAVSKGDGITHMQAVASGSHFPTRGRDLQMRHKMQPKSRARRLPSRADASPLDGKHVQAALDMLTMRGALLKQGWCSDLAVLLACFLPQTYCQKCAQRQHKHACRGVGWHTAGIPAIHTSSDYVMHTAMRLDPEVCQQNYVAWQHVRQLVYA
jgi:hypothetical protein